MPDKVVCHISTVHPLFDPRIFYKECKSLVKAGYEVHLVIPHHKDELIEGIHVHGLSKIKGRFKRILLGPLSAYRRARKIRADVYHLHDPELFIAGKLFWLTGKRVIFDVHENIVQQIRTKQWLPFRKTIAWMYQLVDFFSTKWFYLLLAEKSYASIYRGMTSNYEVILNTPDIEFFNAYRVDRRPMANELFYIGVISESRSLLEILEAIDRIIDEIPDLTFHCIGACPDALMNKVKNLPYYDRIEQHVRFHGRMKLDEGYALSRRCSVGIALLKPIGNYVESYPTKIFEYMSIGLPFVTSDFDLYKKIVEEEGCGLCVDPSDPDAIASAIRKLLLNAEMAHEMGMAGRRAAVERYHWGIEEQKLLTVYENLLANRNQNR